MIGRAPDSLRFSPCDWKRCAVTGYDTTAVEYIRGMVTRKGISMVLLFPVSLLFVEMIMFCFVLFCFIWFLLFHVPSTTLTQWDIDLRSFLELRT